MSKHPKAKIKKVIMVDIVQLLDRDLPEHDAWWQFMCDHHAFRMSNGIILDLGTYWELPDEKGYWNDIDYDVSFPKFIWNYLEFQGADPEEFDNILLNINW